MRALAPRVIDSALAYDMYAVHYDALLSENRINAYMRRTMMALQRETFRPGQRLLELGCGTGDEAIALASAGCDVVGIDPSGEKVRVAEAKAQGTSYSARLSFRVGYARELASLLASQPDGSFDGAYSSFALSYEKDLGVVRDDLHRLLRPGSTFLASAMNRLDGVEWIAALASLHPSLAGRRLRSRASHKVGSVQTTVYCRSATQLARSFSPAFRIVRLRGLPVALPPHYANRPLRPWPGLVAALGRLDAHVAGWPILRHLGDHCVAWFRRSEDAART